MISSKAKKGHFFPNSALNIIRKKFKICTNIALFIQILLPMKLVVSAYCCPGDKEVNVECVSDNVKVLPLEMSFAISK